MQASCSDLNRVPAEMWSAIRQSSVGATAVPTPVAPLGWHGATKGAHDAGPVRQVWLPVEDHVETRKDGYLLLERRQGHRLGLELEVCSHLVRIEPLLVDSAAPEPSAEPRGDRRAGRGKSLAIDVQKAVEEGQCDSYSRTIKRTP